MNFTDPRFDFSIINYDFSKLPENLPRKYCTAFLIKCKGKIVNSKSTKGREVNRGGNISQDIILSDMMICQDIREIWDRIQRSDILLTTR